MFPFPIARPQGCNIQTFYGYGAGVSSSTTDGQQTWSKPVGVSHVYMMLIGAGGNGNNVAVGGGSGAVSVWYGAAQHVPDNLIVIVGGVGSQADTCINYRGTTAPTVGNHILQGKAASITAGGTTYTANFFTASGFFQSVAGQDGVTGNQTASTTTFLSGGADATSSSITANYGYALSTATSNLNGTFLMQPIIVGIGSKESKNGSIGCGGGVTGKGGQGLALIASW